jgi:NAD(P)-dependent dehydrogenase (short-subunit alcohol dehydrogenase family)
MLVRLDGRAAVVTGAAQGLGEATARALHGAGAAVVCADLNEEGARGVAASLGERAIAGSCDVRLKRHVVRAADTAVGSLEAMRQRIPVGRFGEPEEVAAAVLYLCSDEAACVTGATLDLNGGLFMR